MLDLTILSHHSELDNHLRWLVYRHHFHIFEQGWSSAFVQFQTFKKNLKKEEMSISLIICLADSLFADQRHLTMRISENNKFHLSSMRNEPFVFPHLDLVINVIDGNDNQ